MGNTGAKEKDGDYRVKYRSWRLGNKEGAPQVSKSRAASVNASNGNSSEHHADEFLVAEGATTRQKKKKGNGFGKRSTPFAAGGPRRPPPVTAKKVPINCDLKPTREGSESYFSKAEPPRQHTGGVPLPVPGMVSQQAPESPSSRRASESVANSRESTPIGTTPSKPIAIRGTAHHTRTISHDSTVGVRLGSSSIRRVSTSVAGPPIKRGDSHIDGLSSVIAQRDISPVKEPVPREISQGPDSKLEVVQESETTRRDKVDSQQSAIKPIEPVVDMNPSEKEDQFEHHQHHGTQFEELEGQQQKQQFSSPPQAPVRGVGESESRINRSIGATGGIGSIVKAATGADINGSGSGYAEMRSGFEDVMYKTERTTGGIGGIGAAFNNKGFASVIPKAKSTGNLALSRGAFPKYQPDPSRNTKNLQEAVMEQLCDAVTVEMVGAHYSTTPSGRILNHLYKPVYDSVRSHLARMPRRYALSASPVEVASDLRLLSEVTRDPKSVAVYVDRNDANGDEHTVTVVAKDRKSLLDTITRTLTARANITNAEITTTVDGFVLDRFVCQQDDSGMALSAVDIRAEIEHYLFETISPSPPAPVMYAKDGSVIAVPGTSPASMTFLSGDALTAMSPPLRQSDTAAAAASSRGNGSRAQESNIEQDGDSSDDATEIKGRRRGSFETGQQKFAQRAAASLIGTSAQGPIGVEMEMFEADEDGIEDVVDQDSMWEVKFEDIKFIKVIGEGRSGKMYLATLNGKEVAAKRMEIKPSGSGGGGAASSDSLMGEFYREVTIVSKLRHPHVCLFLGVAIQEPVFVTLFELLRGGSLAQLLRCNSRYSFFKVAMDIARGMAYLHHNHVIHRDLKSENILLDDNGRAKVVDFGLSCFAGTTAELTAETGTYRWMAPEVIRHEPYSLSADVYSFGIVLWELLSRQQPYAGMTPVQAAFAVARQNMRPRLPSYVPKSVTVLIKQCWNHNPRVRPPFERILHSLESILQGLSPADRKMLDSDA